MHINNPLTKVEEIIVHRPNALSFILKDFKIIDSFYSKQSLAHYDKFLKDKDKKETYKLANEIHDKFEEKATQAKCYYIHMYNDGVDLPDIEREILNEYGIDL